MVQDGPELLLAVKVGLSVSSTVVCVCVCVCGHFSGGSTSSRQSW